MSGSADHAVAASRLRRRLVVWRILFLLLLVVSAVASLRGRAAHGLGPAVDVLRVQGIITDEPRRVRAVLDAAADDRVRALILRIDSPGGSVTGGENLHDAIARFAARKPVVAVMGGEGASAAYMIALPARRIFASNATLTGSIGVILESPDVSGLLSHVGVAVDQIVSGPLKGQPSIVAPLSPAGRDVLQGIVGDLYEQFVAMVAAGRHMDPARVRALGDGRPYTGHQALPLGLIDAIGTEDDARDWLAASAGVPRRLPLHEIKWTTKRDRFVSLAGSVLKTMIPQGLTLDGAVALWQGPRP